MSELVLSEIWHYPVKSLRGLRLDQATVDARGLAGDRHWMLVDGEGRFLTQRQCPEMSLVDAMFEDGNLRLRAPAMTELVVDTVQPEGERVEVVVWNDRCRARAPSAEADRWFSDYLRRPCRLVHLPADSVRLVDPVYGKADDQVGFADGFPFLLISQASLDELNGRLAQPVPMLRFRPNLVVGGGEAFQEDGWRRIRIGELVFRVVKPCSRCVIPTIDYRTGDKADEPLRTLSSYRRRDSKVYFGQNLIHDGTGSLHEGMRVEVLG